MSADWSTLFSPSHGHSDLAASREPLSPLNDRYRTAAEPLANHLSEADLNHTRVHIEIEWLLHLLDKEVLPGAPSLSNAKREYLHALPRSLSGTEIRRLVHFETTTRHDVKAVEYLIAEHLSKAVHVLDPNTCLLGLREAVHIFYTSEDINNLAYTLAVKATVEQVWLPSARALLDHLHRLSEVSADAPIPVHTHGQPVTPVTMGKEMAVFAHRFAQRIRRVEACEYLGRVNEATGTWAARIVSVPGADWPKVTREFVGGLGLSWNPITAQIESHDWQAELYSDVARAGRIVHNLATDCWIYISMDYFHRNLAAQGSTGSSAMPHKIDPIRFENAEANLEVSEALLNSLASTFAASRMQRGLTNSTTQHNIDIALGHLILACSNLAHGLSGIDPDAEHMAEDLDTNWAVLGEAVQRAMRATVIAGHTEMTNPYERLKELTHGHEVDATTMRDFISTLGLPVEVEEHLLALTPASYIGTAPQIVRWVLPRER